MPQVLKDDVLTLSHLGNIPQNGQEPPSMSCA
jgi:hypothetical protein